MPLFTLFSYICLYIFCLYTPILRVKFQGNLVLHFAVAFVCVRKEENKSYTTKY